MRHIDGASYGDGAPRPMDEDDALEQAESEIRRLKGIMLKAAGLLCIGDKRVQAALDLLQKGAL